LRLRLITALALLGASPAAAIAAEDPFGIAIGAPVSQIEGARPFKPGWYHVASPPVPAPQFSAVAVEAFRSTGVCVVQAVSPLIKADPDGAKVRLAIEHLVQAYSATLGQPDKLDTCKSLICAPDLWTADMLTGDRHYGYRWRPRAGALRRVREVSVIAIAHSTSSFTYMVEYQGDDLTKCIAEENALD
jgi:hypothetical protein